MKVKYHGKEIELADLEDGEKSLDNNDDLSESIDSDKTIEMKPINLQDTMEFKEG